MKTKVKFWWLLKQTKWINLSQSTSPVAQTKQFSNFIYILNLYNHDHAYPKFWRQKLYAITNKPWNLSDDRPVEAWPRHSCSSQSLATSVPNRQDHKVVIIRLAIDITSDTLNILHDDIIKNATCCQNTCQILRLYYISAHTHRARTSTYLRTGVAYTFIVYSCLLEAVAGVAVQIAWGHWWVILTQISHFLNRVGYT